MSARKERRAKRKYSAKERAFLRSLPPNTGQSVRLRLFIEKFGRTDVNYSNMKTICLRLGLKGGGRGSNKRRPIGAEFIQHGYVQVKVPGRRRYVPKHRLLWEQKHGPIPADMVLVCKGDRANVDPGNWELVNRRIQARINTSNNGTTLSYYTAPPELKPTIMTVAKIKHQIREVSK